MAIKQAKIDVTDTLGVDLHFINCEEKKVYKRNEATGKNEPTGEIEYEYRMVSKINGDTFEVRLPEKKDFKYLEAVELVNPSATSYNRTDLNSTYAETIYKFYADDIKSIGLVAEFKRISDSVSKAKEPTKETAK